MMYYINIVM